MSKLIVTAIQQTITRIKVMEPEMYLTYTFPDMPDGVFFIYRSDLLPLAERYEAYEASLLEIHSLDDCNRIKTIAAAALGEALNDDAEVADIHEFEDLWEPDIIDFPGEVIQDFSEDISS